jgi:hypothetical protein
MRNGGRRGRITAVCAEAHTIPVGPKAPPAHNVHSLPAAYVPCRGLCAVRLKRREVRAALGWLCCTETARTRRAGSMHWVIREL